MVAIPNDHRTDCNYAHVILSSIWALSMFLVIRMANRIMNGMGHRRRVFQIVLVVFDLRVRDHQRMRHHPNNSILHQVQMIQKQRIIIIDHCGMAQSMDNRILRVHH